MQKDAGMVCVPQLSTGSVILPAQMLELDMTEPNYEKYYAYRLAHERMKGAFQAGYPLETITIAESIITDRLLSHANFHGAGLNPDRTPLGPALQHFKQHPGTVDP
ncbi:hypothetical protein BB931_01245 [Spiribacter salinus]|nr:hypothetical protein [Spiribacter salinus]